MLLAARSALTVTSGSESEIANQVNYREAVIDMWSVVELTVGRRFAFKPGVGPSGEPHFYVA